MPIIEPCLCTSNCPWSLGKQLWRPCTCRWCFFTKSLWNQCSNRCKLKMALFIIVLYSLSMFIYSVCALLVQLSLHPSPCSSSYVKMPNMRNSRPLVDLSRNIWKQPKSIKSSKRFLVAWPTFKYFIFNNKTAFNHDSKLFAQKFVSFCIEERGWLRDLVSHRQDALNPGYSSPMFNFHHVRLYSICRSYALFKKSL